MNVVNSMNSKIFVPKVKWQIFQLILFILFASFIGFVIFDPLLSGPTGNHNYVLYFVFIISIYAALDAFISVIRKTPQLSLTKEGIECKTLTKSQFYSWHDVGVFKITKYRVRYNTMYFLCAYTDLTHDALHKGAKHTKVSTYDAEISFNIKPFVVGQSDTEKNAFVEEINGWRELYGSPEDNSHHLSDEETKEIINRIRNKRIKSFILIGVAIIAMIYYQS